MASVLRKMRVITSSMSVDDGSDIIVSHNCALSNGERIAAQAEMDILTRMELYFAYSSEKVLNLELLLMQLADKKSCYENLISSSVELLSEFFEKAYQFNFLSGFLISEVAEIENFMSCLQQNVIDARKMFTGKGHCLDDSFSKIDMKLIHAQESLRNSQEQVYDIRKQLNKFENLLAFGNLTNGDFDNVHCSPINSKWNLHAVEHQRHILQSWEKSLAREMDLEKRLSESRYNEKQLKLKLHFAEQDAHCIDDSMQVMVERLLEAENAAEVHYGMSKEFMQILQNGHCRFSTSTTQETGKKKNIMVPTTGKDDAEKSKASIFGVDDFLVLSEAHKTNLEGAEHKSMASSSEVLSLRDRVGVLEEQHRESDNQQRILYLEVSNKENIITSLRENILELQNRVKSAEARCTQLVKANAESNNELGFLGVYDTDEANFLKKKLKESGMQLEHAKASIDAIEEQKNMLCTALSDMEHLTEDLKGKVLKAENRAECAEAKCILLTDTNLELNEELNCLRGKLECLEASLHQADMAKIATAKDIGNRTRVILELVKRLSFEREQLQLQISALRKRNKTLTTKSLGLEKGISAYLEKSEHSIGRSDSNTHDESLIDSRFQKMDEIKSGGGDSEGVSVEKSLPALPKAAESSSHQQLTLKWYHIVMAFFLLLVSAVPFFYFNTRKT